VETSTSDAVSARAPVRPLVRGRRGGLSVRGRRGRLSITIRGRRGGLSIRGRRGSVSIRARVRANVRASDASRPVRLLRGGVGLRA